MGGPLKIQKNTHITVKSKHYSLHSESNNNNYVSL